MEVECMKCGLKEEKQLHLHHIIPKCIGGTDKDERIYLCEKHHNILHNFLLKILWKNRNKDANEIYSAIKDFTKRWCDEGKY